MKTDLEASVILHCISVRGMEAIFIRVSWTFIGLFGSVLITGAIGWGGNDKIRLTDVNVITLHQGKMTNSRRSHPVPQLKCVGGSAGCSAFTPSVVQCYNRGSDGYDVQWECKTDMDSQYKFGEVAVSCEGYDYPDDPYILKGSCGLEYTIDVISSGGYYDHNNYHSGHRDDSYPNYYRHNYHSRHSGGWLSTIITWGVIAWIVYYIYQRLTQSQAQPNNSTGDHGQFSSPPPPGFRPEYVPGGHNTHYSNGAGDAAGTAGGQGFWSGAATGGLLGYLFGSSGSRSTYYDHHGYHGPRYNRRWPGYGFGGGSGWFGSNNSWSSGSSSGWTSGSNYRGSSTSPSSRTTSGFGGTRRR